MMRALMVGIGGPAKVRAVVYLVAFAIFGALVIFGVMSLDDADRWFTLAGGALGMSTMGLSLKNLQKAPDVIDESGAAVEPAAPAGGLGALLAAVEAMVQRIESVGGSVSAPAHDGVPASDSVLARRLALEARAIQ